MGTCLLSRFRTANQGPLRLEALVYWRLPPLRTSGAGLAAGSPSGTTVWAASAFAQAARSPLPRPRACPIRPGPCRDGFTGSWRVVTANEFIGWVRAPRGRTFPRPTVLAYGSDPVLS